MPHMLSATAETSHEPIGPWGPLEQLDDSLRHSTMAAWSSPLDCGVQAVVGCYYSGYMVAARVRVRMMIRVSIRCRLKIIVLPKRLHCGIDISAGVGSVISDKIVS